MPDKSNFTPDEWKLLLESVMMAGIAVTTAEPSGLWGLLKESFAGGSALATAKMDPKANMLIKAVVADFETADGRSTARDGLNEKLAGCKPAEIKAKCIETLRQAGGVVDAKAPGDAAAFKGLAAPEQPTRCGGLQGGWISRHRRRGGERGREGNTYRNRKCTEARGLNRSLGPRAIRWKRSSSRSSRRLSHSVR